MHKEEKNKEMEVNFVRKFNASTIEVDEAKPILSIKSVSKSILNFNLKKLINKKKNDFYFEILKKINMRIFRKDRIAILGRNGSGKTTLVEIIAGFKKPTSGFLEYNFDYDISPYEKISLLVQNSNYLNNFTVEEIKEYMINYANEQLDINSANNLSKILQIDSLLGKKFKNLSGGQKQRVSLFLTLIHKPTILILDEFTTNLDIYSRKEMIDYLKLYLKENDVVLILISHDPRIINKLCQKIVVLDKGEITKTISNLKENFKSEKELEKFIYSILSKNKINNSDNKKGI